MCLAALSHAVLQQQHFSRRKQGWNLGGTWPRCCRTQGLGLLAIANVSFLYTSNSNTLMYGRLWLLCYGIQPSIQSSTRRQSRMYRCNLKEPESHHVIDSNHPIK